MHIKNLLYIFLIQFDSDYCQYIICLQICNEKKRLYIIMTSNSDERYRYTALTSNIKVFPSIKIFPSIKKRYFRLQAGRCDFVKRKWDILEIIIFRRHKIIVHKKIGIM